MLAVFFRRKEGSWENCETRWWFHRFFGNSRSLGKMESNFTSIFFNWVAQPPTRIKNGLNKAKPCDILGGDEGCNQGTSHGEEVEPQNPQNHRVECRLVN